MPLHRSVLGMRTNLGLQGRAVLPNWSLKRDLRRHGTWPARLSGLSSASRAKRHTGSGPLAQTLGRSMHGTPLARSRNPQH